MGDLLQIDSNKVLDVRSSGLQEFSFEEGVQLSLLTQLILRDNVLTKLPDAIGGLTSLELLDVSQNNLLTIPRTIINLTRLQTLNLSDNSRISLPREVWRISSLGMLFLTNTGLNSVPSEVGLLTSLIRLDLNANPSLCELPPELTDLNESCRINITGTGLVRE